MFYDRGAIASFLRIALTGGQQLRAHHVAHHETVLTGSEVAEFATLAIACGRTLMPTPSELFHTRCGFVDSHVGHAGMHKRQGWRHATDPGAREWMTGPGDAA